MSHKKYKYMAEAALAQSAALENEQRDIDFRRGLLSNIRQERLARAMIEQGNYSDDFTTSSSAGAIANLQSSLAGETHYAYDTSARAQKIQDLNRQAEELYKKYQEGAKKKAGKFSSIGSIVGAVGGGAIGFMVGGPAGAVAGATMGAQVGQGIGQVAANTGTKNTMQGVQNIIGGATNSYQAFSAIKEVDRLKGYGEGGLQNRWQVESVNPQTGAVIPGSLQNVSSIQKVNSIFGW